MKPRMLGMVALLTMVAAVVTADLEPSRLDSADVGRGKKGDKMMHEMVQAMMLAKNMVSFALMFVSPIMQIKGFGLSVVNTLINIGRFLVQLQATQQMKQMQMDHLKIHYGHAHQAHDSEDLWSSASNSRYAYYAPPPKQFLRQDPGPGVIENLPPTHPSYTSTGPQQNNHPIYSPNFTRLR